MLSDMSNMNVKELVNNIDEIKKLPLNEFFRCCEDSESFFLVAYDNGIFLNKAKDVIEHNVILSSLPITYTTASNTKIVDYAFNRILQSLERAPLFTEPSTLQLELKLVKDILNLNSSIMKLFSDHKILPHCESLVEVRCKALAKLTAREESLFKIFREINIDLLFTLDESKLNLGMLYTFTPERYDVDLLVRNEDVEVPDISKLEVYKQLLIVAIKQKRLAKELVENSDKCSVNEFVAYGLEAPIKKILLEVKKAQNLIQSSSSEQLKDLNEEDREKFANIMKLTSEFPGLVAKLFFTHEELIPAYLRVLDFDAGTKTFNLGIPEAEIEAKIEDYLHKYKEEPVRFVAGIYFRAICYLTIIHGYINARDAIDEQLNTKFDFNQFGSRFFDEYKYHSLSEADKKLYRALKTAYKNTDNKSSAYDFRYYMFLTAAVAAGDVKTFKKFKEDLMSNAFKVLVNENVDLNLDTFQALYVALLRVIGNSLTTPLDEALYKHDWCHRKPTQSYIRALILLKDLLLDGMPKLIGKQRFNNLSSENRIIYLRSMLPILDKLTTFGDELAMIEYELIKYELYALEYPTAYKAFLKNARSNNDKDKDAFVNEQRKKIQANSRQHSTDLMLGFEFANSLMGLQENEELEQGSSSSETANTSYSRPRF